MKNNKTAGISFLICLIGITSLFTACKKTEYEQIKRPYNNIERFSLAAYGNLDSVNAVISGDTVYIYWNGETAPPATITPVISISAGASIMPASGTAVTFKDTTTYTVTAEDGSIRKYKIKPVFNVAVPRLTSLVAPNRWVWEANFPLLIDGQYFFSAGNAADIKVYAQRLRDGFEFNLTVNQTLTTATQLNLNLPKMTAELDSGLHRIWVQVGAFPSNYLDVWIKQPLLENVITSARLKEAGGPVYLGDTLTVVYTHTLSSNELFNKYFKKENILLHNVGCYKTYNIYVNNAPIVSLKDGELKFVLAADKFSTHLGSYINQSILYYNVQNNATGDIGNTIPPNTAWSPAATADQLKATIISQKP